MPIPETETQCKNVNLKTLLCAVIQLSDCEIQPIDKPIAYALLLNDCTLITNWIITGETNDDGVFHTHCLLQTTVRSDSAKRSLTASFDKLKLKQRWIEHYMQDSTCDINKIQKCHKPESMFGYIMKSPQWVVSNCKPWLDLAYAIDQWDLNQRFKIPKDTFTAQDINKMTEEILAIVIEGQCKTLEDCIKYNPDIMAKYLHKPSLGSIVQNCVTFAKATGGTFNIQLFEKYDCNPQVIHKILLHQGIKPSDFDQAFYKWITKAEPKINTIVIQGPSNTGKSQFIYGLKQLLPWGEICNGNNGFNFEMLIDQTIGVWEEPLIGSELAEKCKQVMEGMTCAINVKYKKPFLLPRTPIIVTTNHDIWRYCTQEELMFTNRIWRFFFTHPVKDVLYTCRAIEPSCKCPYCQASCGRAILDDSTSTSGLQTTNESIRSDELSSGSTEESTLSTGPLLDPGEGTSRSCTTFSSDITATTSSSSGQSTSTTTLRQLWSGIPIRSISTGNRDDSSQSISTKHLESDRHRGHNDPPLRRDGSTRHLAPISRKRSGGNTLSTSSRHQLPTNNISQKEKTLPIQPKQRKLDRTVSSLTTKIPLCIPLLQDWRDYLCYLSCKYG